MHKKLVISGQHKATGSRWKYVKLRQTKMEKKEEAENSNSSIIKSGNRKWAIALVTLITLARLGQGLYSAMPGPTLLFLADNTGTTVGGVSVIFTGKSGGMLAGSFLFSGIMNRVPTFRPLLTLSIGFVICGIASICIPFCTELWVLTTATVIGGASLGYFECGLQSVYLKLWGEEDSRPYIQSFHFGYSIGTFLAPLLAAPFLKMASEDEETNPTCPGDDEITTSSPFTVTSIYNYSTTEKEKRFDGINPISWPYVIVGIYIIINSIMLFVLALLQVERRLETRHEKTFEKRKEEPFLKVAVLLTVVVIFYSFFIASENCFANYIYSIAICSDLQFSVTQASLLSTVFWLGFGISRGLGIILAKFFGPSTLQIVDISVSTVSLAIISIWGEQSAGLTWAITFIYGFFVGRIYSTGVTWISRETNMTGTYMVVFSIGIGIGGMGLVPVGGIIFDIDPFSVLYYATGTAVVVAIMYALLEFLSYRRKRRVFTNANGEVNGNFQLDQDKVYTTKM